MTLVIVSVLHPGSQSIQDASTHIFAILAGAILHDTVKNNASKS